MKIERHRPCRNHMKERKRSLCVDDIFLHPAVHRILRINDGAIKSSLWTLNIPKSRLCFLKYNRISFTNLTFYNDYYRNFGIHHCSNSRRWPLLSIDSNRSLLNDFGGRRRRKTEPPHLFPLPPGERSFLGSMALNNFVHNIWESSTRNVLLPLDGGETKRGGGIWE